MGPPLLLPTPPLWSTLLMPLPLLWSTLLSTPPLSTVELARCPTSPCPSRSRVSTGPPPSPRPTELTAGTDLLLLDMELSSVEKINSGKPNHHEDHLRRPKTRLTFQQQN